MGIIAYKRTISDTEGPRQIERRVLAETTARLEQFLDFHRSERMIGKLSILANGLREAIWANQQIWSAFKYDLAAEHNSLPPGLRATLISLAIWVENHSAQVMKGNEELSPLIDINRTIIRGLSGESHREAG